MIAGYLPTPDIPKGEPEMSNDADALKPHRFGDPITPSDVLQFITAPEANFGDAVEEATPYYYGRWKALVCAFRIAGEVMNRSSKELLLDRLGECHALTKRLV